MVGHDMISIGELSEKWGISASRIARLCRDGRIPGAAKNGRSWSVPSDSLKPDDARKNIPIQFGSVEKPLPIGVSSFRKAVTDYYYVDKTLLIKDLIDSSPVVSLYTRPRRFGKSLNMDMLRVFFEKTDEDTSFLFRDKKIWSSGAGYRMHQGKYPVIYLSLKDIEGRNWEESFELIRHVIILEYRRHPELDDPNANPLHDFYRTIVSGVGDESSFMLSLLMLSKMLSAYHREDTVVIIDEYDTPITHSYINGYYNRCIMFMRNLFSAVLKDNERLKFGILSGILRIAKESIFSGLNNLRVFSVLDDQFSSYFGFTSDEVRQMLSFYGCEDKYDEVLNWYDGYLFGSTEIFNPWSVVLYISSGCNPDIYWLSTGNNDVIRTIIGNGDVSGSLSDMLSGKAFTTVLDMAIAYPEIKHDSDVSATLSFLTAAGYLKAKQLGLTDTGEKLCLVMIPNREIMTVYRKEIIGTLEQRSSAFSYMAVLSALQSGDPKRLQSILNQFLLSSVSFFDTARESFYHGLLLGLMSVFSSCYRVESERESGYGRYDIMMVPLSSSYPGIVFEIKVCESEEIPESVAEKALNQIRSKEYTSELRCHDVRTAILFAVAFQGKKVKVLSETVTLN